VGGGAAGAFNELINLANKRFPPIKMKLLAGTRDTPKIKSFG